MKISIASDHGGYELKEYIKNNLKGYDFFDCGCFNKESVDYPDFCKKACEMLVDKEVERAFVICSTGIGMSIQANKYKGIRCALVTNIKQAKLTREHNDSNALALGALNQSNEEALEFAKVFLETEFSNDERHIRRINKIEDKEN